MNKRSKLAWLYSFLWTCLVVFGMQSCSTSLKYSYNSIEGPVYQSDFRKSSPEEIIRKEQIKVVSFNIEFSQNISGAIDLIQKSSLNDTDVFLLQEMDSSGTAEIASALKMTSVYFPAIWHPKYKKDVGIAILSKWPIINFEKIILPFSTSYPSISKGKNYKFQKIAVWAEIVVNNKSINFISTHAPALGTTKSRGIFTAFLADYINKNIDGPAVVGGDFNSFGQADKLEIVSHFSQYNFEWATEKIGITVSEKKSFLKYIPDEAFQLDHIFLRDLNISEVGKLQQVGVSDHLPIWMIIEL